MKIVNGYRVPSRAEILRAMGTVRKIQRGARKKNAQAELYYNAEQENGFQIVYYPAITAEGFGTAEAYSLLPMEWHIISGLDPIKMQDGGTGWKWCKNENYAQMLHDAIYMAALEGHKITTI